MKKFTRILVLCLLICNVAIAQSVSINNDGSPPSASAMLDVKHANKGLLLPRVALTGTDDVATIPAPLLSLLVFNTATTSGGTAVTPG